MGKFIWMIMAAIWILCAVYGVKNLMALPAPVPDSLKLFLSVVGFVLLASLASLVTSQWWLVSRVLVWSLRGPILIVLAVITVIGQFLMKIENMVVRVGHKIIPSTSGKGGL